MLLCVRVRPHTRSRTVFDVFARQTPKRVSNAFINRRFDDFHIKNITVLAICQE